MNDVRACSKECLAEMKVSLEKEYEAFRARGLNLDMSRGKPAPSQLDLSNGLLEKMDGYTSEDGTDIRNYGGPLGIPEARKLFSELLGQ